MAAALADSRTSAALVMNAVSVLIDEMVTTAFPQLPSFTSGIVLPGPLFCAVVDPVAIRIDEALSASCPCVR